jgi:flagellar motility protein MotE (MotC chaperone)
MAVKRTPMKPDAAQAGGMPAMPPVKGKRPKKPKKLRKPLPRFLLVAFTVLAMLLLVGGAGACLYFNVGGAADFVMGVFPPYRAALAAVEPREKALADAEAKLKAEQEKLAAGQADLKGQTEELTKAQEKLAADKKAFAESKKATPAPSATATAGNKGQDVAKIYEALDAGDAAEMLLKAPALREAADILSSLPTEKTAQIIAAIKALDAKKAYDLTKLIGQ